MLSRARVGEDSVALFVRAGLDAALCRRHGMARAVRGSDGEARRDRVLVQGGGGVSTFALQLARYAGADGHRDIELAGEARAPRADGGGRRRSTTRADPKWGDTATSRGRRMAASILSVEVGGAGTFDQSIASLRYGGPDEPPRHSCGHAGSHQHLRDLLHKNIRIRGVYVGSIAMFEAARTRARSTRTSIRSSTRVFRFSTETRAAYEHLASGAHFGKVVIRLD